MESLLYKVGVTIILIYKNTTRKTIIKTILKQLL